MNSRLARSSIRGAIDRAAVDLRIEGGQRLRFTDVGFSDATRDALFTVLTPGPNADCRTQSIESVRNMTHRPASRHRHQTRGSSRASRSIPRPVSLRAGIPRLTMLPLYLHCERGPVSNCDWHAESRDVVGSEESSARRPFLCTVNLKHRSEFLRTQTIPSYVTHSGGRGISGEYL